MRLTCAAAVCLLLAKVVLAAEPPEYTQMRAARPDGRTIAVQNLKIDRDVYRFHFTSGTFHFLAPLGDKTWGAVFLGDGRFELRPSAEVERRHLAMVTAQSDLEIFEDSFDQIVLLFGDATFDEITKGKEVVAGSPDTRAGKAYQEYLDAQKRRVQINLHLRVLQDLLATPPPASGAFLGVVDGKRFAPALLVVDPRGISSVGAGLSGLSGEETAYLSFDDNNGGFWYLNASGPAGKGGLGKAPHMLVDATRYVVDTSIEGKGEIRATTTIEFTPLVAGVRVLPLNILPKLRLRRAALNTAEGGVELATVQEEVALGKLARLVREEVADADAAVVFPEALTVGKSTKITVDYEGRDVLHSFGPDSYSVRARESWYPNTNTFVDLADYELTFRFPKRNNLISTGKLVSEKEEGNRKVSVWKSETPMRVAGFNYGRFDKTSRHDEPSRTDIDVFTNREDKKFANDTLADAMNTARVGTAFFGRPPFTPISVTQQPEFFFGQSWPSLIYLPSIALTSSTDRMMMFDGLIPTDIHSLNEFAKMVGWHEMAHQWWGHAVGWASYRDQWLSEGFAEFTAALVLQVTENTGKYDDYWERQRRDILNKQRGHSFSYNDAGPISQGFRVSSSYAPGAAQGVVYTKGGYVLHMLRMLMRDRRQENPDTAFMKMMQDFVASYSGKSATTADFKKVVERHMAPQMDAARNGKMDWFFDQWVYGTHVPRLKSSVTAKESGGGKYKLSGWVSQEGVYAEFLSMVPIYVDFGGDTMAQIGAIRLVGNKSEPIEVEIPLPQPPKRIVINARHEVLVRD